MVAARRMVAVPALTGGLSVIDPPELDSDTSPLFVVKPAMGGVKPVLAAVKQVSPASGVAVPAAKLGPSRKRMKLPAPVLTAANWLVTLLAAAHRSILPLAATPRSKARMTPAAVCTTLPAAPNAPAARSTVLPATGVPVLAVTAAVRVMLPV